MSEAEERRMGEFPCVRGITAVAAIVLTSVRVPEDAGTKLAAAFGTKIGRVQMLLCLLSW